VAVNTVGVAGDEPRGTSGEAPELAIWAFVARASQLSPSHPKSHFAFLPVGKTGRLSPEGLMPILVGIIYPIIPA